MAKIDPHPDMAHLGYRLRETRTRLKLTQTDLAELAGVEQATVSHYESGKRHGSIALAVVMKICDALEVPLQFIAYGHQGHDSSRSVGARGSVNRKVAAPLGQLATKKRSKKPNA